MPLPAHGRTQAEASLKTRACDSELSVLSKDSTHWLLESKAELTGKELTLPIQACKVWKRRLLAQRHRYQCKESRIWNHTECTYNGVCMCAQSCLALCYSMDYSPPGSSVQGYYPSKHWNELLFPPSGDLPDSGIKPVSCSSFFGRQILYHWVTSPEKLIYSGVKLEFNNRKKVRLFINPWKLDSTLLIKTVDQKKKLKVDRKRYLETREIGNKIYQKLWNAEKAVLRGNFRALN